MFATKECIWSYYEVTIKARVLIKRETKKRKNFKLIMKFALNEKWKKRFRRKNE